MSITKERALAIANEDAKLQYPDLSVYEVTAEFDGENWRVVYVLKDPALDGGGPLYVISGADGRMVHREYEQ